MTPFSLRILALTSMLLDHVGFVLLPSQAWLRCFGRLAFPIFCYQLIEGYYHSRSKSRYALRLLALATLSEIPYDLMMFSAPFSPARQNTIWSLLLGLVTVHLMEVIRQKCPHIFRETLLFLSIFVSAILATVLSLDYGAFGLLQIVVFYLLRAKPIGLQVLCIALINLLFNESSIRLFGVTLPAQSFAILAMVPIALDKGTKRSSRRAWTAFCRLFYPFHMLLLSLLRLWLCK